MSDALKDWILAMWPFGRARRPESPLERAALDQQLAAAWMQEAPPGEWVPFPSGLTQGMQIPDGTDADGNTWTNCWFEAPAPEAIDGR